MEVQNDAVEPVPSEVHEPAPESVLEEKSFQLSEEQAAPQVDNIASEAAQHSSPSPKPADSYVSLLDVALDEKSEHKEDLGHRSPSVLPNRRRQRSSWMNMFCCGSRDASPVDSIVDNKHLRRY